VVGFGKELNSISAEIKSALAGIKSNLYFVGSIILSSEYSLLTITSIKECSLLSLSSPVPVVEFPCESRSINKTLREAADKEAARFKAVVVFPTPPFWLATTKVINKITISVFFIFNA
jgi:hypothetical protein